MKKLRFISIILSLALIITFLLQGTNVQASVTLSKSKASLYVGESLTLKVSGTSSKVTWSSNNKKVATVSKGKVTAKNVGTAIITAKIGSKKYTCDVTVKYNTNSMIKDSYDWLVTKVWNDCLCDITWYTNSGTDSNGNEMSKKTVDKKLRTLKKLMQDENKYTDFYNSLKVSKYKELKKLWNKLIKELDYMYDIILDSEIIANSNIEYKYADDFGLQLYDFMSLAYEFY